MIKYILKSLLSFALILIVGFFLWISIFKLQVSNAYEENQLASFIDQKSETLVAQRGNIYDRNGVLLAYNEAGYKVIFDNTSLSLEKSLEVVSKVSEIAKIDKNDLLESFRSKVLKGDKEIKFRDTLLVPSIERDQVLKIASRKDELQGIKVTTFFKRKYVYPYVLSHVVGYTFESLPDIEVGKFGVEKSYDQILSGTNGYISTTGQIIPPVNGEDIYLTIDISLQQKLYDSINEKMKRESLGSGGAVISNIKNGEVLAMVSVPGFDTNMFSSFLSKKDYEKLLSDPNLPLINKVISLPQPTGSTFKPFVGLALLDSGTIDKSYSVVSEGCMDLSQKGETFCEAGKKSFGKIDFNEAIARSSNIFFCKAMLKMGIDKLNTYADTLNLNTKSDLDLKEEVKSTIASKELKKRIENSAWFDGDTCNTAIGQGLNKISLIQLMNLTSNIANGGSTYTPHLVIRSTKDFQYKPNIYISTNISKTAYEQVRSAMRDSVIYGTSKKLSKLSTEFGGKTGSAQQSGSAKATSFSIGFWPYTDPSYSFAIFLEEGSFGSSSLDPIVETLSTIKL